MKIGISSQNFRSITGHAGKGRRFMVYSVSDRGEISELERIDLPLEMSMHAWSGIGGHPLFALDCLITASCGDGFIRKMASHGVEVKVTSETDPQKAILALLDGQLPPGVPHSHEHDHEH